MASKKDKEKVCAVRGCKSSSWSHQSMEFFPFPQQYQQTFKAWFEFANCQIMNPRWMCQRHFDVNQFIDYSSLHRHAVPTLFPGLPTPTSPPKPAKQPLNARKHVKTPELNKEGPSETFRDIKALPKESLARLWSNNPAKSKVKLKTIGIGQYIPPNPTVLTENSSCDSGHERQYDENGFLIPQAKPSAIVRTADGIVLSRKSKQAPPNFIRSLNKFAPKFERSPPKRPRFPDPDDQTESIPSSMDVDIYKKISESLPLEFPIATKFKQAIEELEVAAKRKPNTVRNSLLNSSNFNKQSVNQHVKPSPEKSTTLVLKTSAKKIDLSIDKSSFQITPKTKPKIITNKPKGNSEKQGALKINATKTAATKRTETFPKILYGTPKTLSANNNERAYSGPYIGCIQDETLLKSTPNIVQPKTYPGKRSVEVNPQKEGPSVGAGKVNTSNLVQVDPRSVPELVKKAVQIKGSQGLGSVLVKVDPKSVPKSVKIAVQSERSKSDLSLGKVPESAQFTESQVDSSGPIRVDPSSLPILVETAVKSKVLKPGGRLENVNLEIPEIGNSAIDPASSQDDDVIFLGSVEKQSKQSNSADSKDKVGSSKTSGKRQMRVKVKSIYEITLANTEERDVLVAPPLEGKTDQGKPGGQLSSGEQLALVGNSVLGRLETLKVVNAGTPAASVKSSDPRTKIEEEKLKTLLAQRPAVSTPVPLSSVEHNYSVPISDTDSTVEPDSSDNLSISNTNDQSLCTDAVSKTTSAAILHGTRLMGSKLIEPCQDVLLMRAAEKDAVVGSDAPNPPAPPASVPLETEDTSKQTSGPNQISSADQPTCAAVVGKKPPHPTPFGRRGTPLILKRSVKPIRRLVLPKHASMQPKHAPKTSEKSFQIMDPKLTNENKVERTLNPANGAHNEIGLKQTSFPKDVLGSLAGPSSSSLSIKRSGGVTCSSSPSKAPSPRKAAVHNDLVIPIKPMSKCVVKLDDMFKHWDLSGKASLPTFLVASGKPETSISPTKITSDGKKPLEVIAFENMSKCCVELVDVLKQRHIIKKYCPSLLKKGAQRRAIKRVRGETAEPVTPPKRNRVDEGTDLSIGASYAMVDIVKLYSGFIILQHLTQLKEPSLSTLYVQILTGASIVESSVDPHYRPSFIYPLGNESKIDLDASVFVDSTLVSKIRSTLQSLKLMEGDLKPLIADEAKFDPGRNVRVKSLTKRNLPPAVYQLQLVLTIVISTSPIEGLELNTKATAQFPCIKKMIPVVKQSFCPSTLNPKPNKSSATPQSFGTSKQLVSFVMIIRDECISNASHCNMVIVQISYDKNASSQRSWKQRISVVEPSTSQSSGETTSLPPPKRVNKPVDAPVSAVASNELPDSETEHIGTKPDEQGPSDVPIIASPSPLRHDHVIHTDYVSIDPTKLFGGFTLLQHAYKNYLANGACTAVLSIIMVATSMISWCTDTTVSAIQISDFMDKANSPGPSQAFKSNVFLTLDVGILKDVPFIVSRLKCLLQSLVQSNAGMDQNSVRTPPVVSVHERNLFRWIVKGFWSVVSKVKDQIPPDMKREKAVYPENLFNNSVTVRIVAPHTGDMRQKTSKSVVLMGKLEAFAWNYTPTGPQHDLLSKGLSKFFNDSGNPSLKTFPLKRSRGRPPPRNRYKPKPKPKPIQSINQINQSLVGPRKLIPLKRSDSVKTYGKSDMSEKTENNKTQDGKTSGAVTVPVDDDVESRPEGDPISKTNQSKVESRNAPENPCEGRKSTHSQSDAGKDVVYVPCVSPRSGETTTSRMNPMDSAVLGNEPQNGSLQRGEAPADLLDEVVKATFGSDLAYYGKPESVACPDVCAKSADLPETKATEFSTNVAASEASAQSLEDDAVEVIFLPVDNAPPQTEMNMVTGTDSGPSDTGSIHGATVSGTSVQSHKKSGNDGVLEPETEATESSHNMTASETSAQSLEVDDDEVIFLPVDNAPTRTEMNMVNGTDSGPSDTGTIRDASVSETSVRRHKKIGNDGILIQSTTTQEGTMEMYLVAQSDFDDSSTDSTEHCSPSKDIQPGGVLDSPKALNPSQFLDSGSAHIGNSQPVAQTGAHRPKSFSSDAIDSESTESIHPLDSSSESIFVGPSGVSSRIGKSMPLLD